MANRVRKIAEVQEGEWTQAASKIILGAAVFLVAAALLYCAKFLFKGTLLQFAHICLALAAFAGVAIIGAAIYHAMQTRKVAGVGFACPYCDRVNRFEAEPNEDFDCEFCNRTVHFEGGTPVRVRTITCPFCTAEHRVAVNVHRYVCDSCNRPLELAAERRGPAAVTAGADPESASAQNYDVLLVAVDRRHENEVALKLQNLLIVNLPEARRLMATASTSAPLVVSHGLPQRKAEAVRRQLQDLGATATLRPTNEGVRPASRAR